jgi:hypothetical protein
MKYFELYGTAGKEERYLEENGRKLGFERKSRRTEPSRGSYLPEYTQGISSKRT